MLSCNISFVSPCVLTLEADANALRQVPFGELGQDNDETTADNCCQNCLGAGYSAPVHGLMKQISSMRVLTIMHESKSVSILMG